MVKREPDSRGRLPGIGRKRSWGRRIKRRFYGNKKKEKVLPREASTSILSIKIKEEVDIPNVEENHQITDTNILSTQIEKMVTYDDEKKEKELSLEASASTLSVKIEEEIDIPNEEENHKIIDINILFPQLEKMVNCNKCHGKIKITELDASGLRFKINIICEQQCQQETIVNSLKLVEPQYYDCSTIALQALGLS